MDTYERKDMDEPLSESSVSLQLSLIRKRCGELMDGSEELELSLEEESMAIQDGSDPYNQQR